MGNVAKFQQYIGLKKADRLYEIECYNFLYLMYKHMVCTFIVAIKGLGNPTFPLILLYNAFFPTFGPCHLSQKVKKNTVYNYLSLLFYSI